MGLMNRVLDTRRRAPESQVPSGATGEQPATGQATTPKTGLTGSARLQHILDDIAKNQGGVAIPGRLFDLLIRGLGISAGALLIRDSASDEFKPWACIGLDPTTVSRLTMTRQQIAHVCPDFVRSYRPDNVGPLSPFLSFRQRAALEYAVVLRLRFKGRLAGLLLLLDAGIFQMESENREMLLSALSEPIAREIVERRDAILDRMYSPLILESTDFKRAVRNIADDIDLREQALVLLRVETELPQQAFIQTVPRANAKRAADDIRSVISALLGGTGDLCSPADEVLLCCALVPIAENGEMLVNELGDKLCDFFPELPPTYAPRCKTWTFPGEDADLDRILNELFSEP